MAPERYDASAQVALLKVLTDVLRLQYAADVMYDPDQAQALRDGLARIDVSKPAASMAALADCVVLGQALKTLDPTFDATQMDRAGGPSRWLITKRNLLVVYKGTFAYIRRSCWELMALAKVYDIRTTAKSPDDQSMSQLASTIVVAAFLGENNRDYIARLQTLEPAILEPIMRIIMAKQEECKKLADSIDADELIDQILQIRDVDLAHEEEHASILIELETSRKQGSDLLSRLEHLQRNYDELVQAHNRQQDELTELRRSGTDNEFTSQRDKQRIREQEDVIASQEGEIQGYNETIRGLKVQIREYEKRVQRIDDLSDQVTELRHTNTELSKKANTAERYKQKLEAQQSLVTENHNLQFEKASLQKDYEDAVTKISTLDESLRKYRSRDESHAHAITEAGREVEDLRIELMKRDEELANLKALREHDERLIYELQDQLRSGQVSSTQSIIATPNYSTTTSLEQELNGAEEESPVQPAQLAPPAPPTTALEISRLRAEIALLKSNTVSAEELARLRGERDSERAQCGDLRRERFEYLEQLACQKKLVRDLLDSSTSEGTQAYRELDSKYATAKAESDREKKRAGELAVQLSDLRRELVVANASLSAVSQQETGALETLKKADFTVCESLKKELEANRQEGAKLQTDLAQLQADLVAAYQSKEQLRKDFDEARETQGRFSDSTAADEEAAEATKKPSNEKMDKLRARLKQRTEQLDKAEQEKFELQRKLKALQNEGGPSGHQRDTIKALQRETTLMTTAWYDMVSRIHSTHVELQRRSEMPKSWISRQRQSVNATPRR